MDNMKQSAEACGNSWRNSSYDAYVTI